MDVEDQNLLAPSREQLASFKVFPLIASLKREVTETIDSPLTWDQLTASDINFSIVRPIIFKYARLENMAIVYACLVVRSNFLSEVEEDLAYSGVMLSRAMLCEILAMKLLAHWSTNYIHLVAVLTTSWNPLTGATPDIVHEVKLIMGGNDDDLNCPQSALEMAISTDAKTFISSPVTQKVVNDIYSGRVVFSTASTRSMLADNYKPRAIEIYDTRKAPFIDHYRLRVPRYGAILEFLNFAILLITFVLCLATRDLDKMAVWEIIFVVFAVAFALEEYTASAEHGWIIYIANMWNVFDTSFVLIFLAYLILRAKGLITGDTATSEISLDLLSCGACILFPRLAFFAVSNNVVILSLRAMIAEFVFFIAIASICFSGLLFTLWTLARDNENSDWTVGGIAWLMVQIWFGNTYLSFDQAASFHPGFGPILMTVYAALSGTLLLTILISILSNTVARIDANATQEYLYQFAISTIEGVQSNALVSYQPPFNVLALLILKPSSYFLTPRALHSANVFLIKVTHLPILFCIGLYERYLAAGQQIRERGAGAAHSLFNSLPRHLRAMPLVEAFVGSTSSDLYEAIFEIEVDEEELTTKLFGELEGIDHDLPALRSITSREGIRARSPGSPAKRRPSRRNRDPPSPLESPRLRASAALSVQDFPLSGEVPNTGNRSPLSKLFGAQVHSPEGLLPQQQHHIEHSMRRVETMLDDIKDLPVNRLKDEMKELQDRQARIENLLLVLTRGMRNDTLGRHDTMPMSPRPK